MERYIVYYRDGQRPVSADCSSRDENYTYSIWTPAINRVFPHGLVRLEFLKTWLYYLLYPHLKLDYEVFLICQQGTVLHHAVVTCKSPKFPFMEEKDKQIGQIFTHRQYRRRGLALHTLQMILSVHGNTTRRFWYVVGEVNTASRELALKTGFQIFGAAVKTGFIGKYRLMEESSLHEGLRYGGKQIDEAGKRIFDVGFALLALVICSPLMGILSYLIRAEDGGPVFYGGVRVGKQGELFRMFKFRTMVVNAEKLGGASTADDDPRITKVGKFLRKYKLDELPQLINVFRGEMSFVGPRPEVKHYVDMFTEEEKAILSVRPGITDWATLWNSDEGAILAGSRDPEKTYMEKIRPEKIRLQLKYVRERSFWVDLKIIFQTLLVILK